MIDSIGSKSVSASDLRTDTATTGLKVAKIAAAGQPQAVTMHIERPVSLGAAQAVQQMAAEPPVNSDRVAQIKKAVQEGTFPIYPATVADRLIAFEQGWRTQ